MSNNFKAWLSWKGISKLSSARKRKEAFEMVYYYETHKPVNMPYKRQY